MSKFIDGINHLESQWWAMFLVLLGLATFFRAEAMHISAGDLPQTLIVAGVAILRVTPRNASMTVNAPNATTQQVNGPTDNAPAQPSA